MNQKEIIIEALRKIFCNDSKIQPRLFNDKYLEKTISEIFTSILKTRPKNVKLKQLMNEYSKNNGVIFRDKIDEIVLDPEPIKKQVVPKTTTTTTTTATTNSSINSNIKSKTLEIKQEEIIKLSKKEQEEKWIQDFLDRNNFSNIPAFEGLRPLNKEAEIILAKKETSEKTKKNFGDPF
jgi:hypothetical protein